MDIKEINVFRIIDGKHIKSKCVKLAKKIKVVMFKITQSIKVSDFKDIINNKLIVLLLVSCLGEPS